MSRAAGTRIGPYDIVALLGAGGMGEVYRARDTRLKRDVALKVLPAALAGDRERLARFQREAEVLAALNHPHIAHIHGLEEADGTFALVMELVEGEDLSARIAHGAIPLEEALPIALQIIDALDAAHERGIIHRDLKPANIKVRDDGTVKVLDFGLAKALAPDSASAPADNLMNSPTMTSPMTQMGMILGTAAYMSPEQARGKAVDRRADIWAFGCVLYEMLTGKRPFDGDTITDIMAAIVKTEPDWDALPPGVPRAVRATMRRCLAKDPKQRLRDIGDATFEIREPDVAVASAAPSGPSSSRRTAALVLAAVTVLTVGVAGGIAWRSGRDVPPVAWTGGRVGGPAIASFPRVSPDGQLLAFQAMVSGQSQVAVMKPDTGNWSVLTRDRSKGLVDSLAWSDDGARIYFDRFIDAPRGIYSVPALGGDERLLIEDAARPEPLPDGSLLLVRLNDDRQVQMHRLWPENGRLEPLPALLPPLFDQAFMAPIDEERTAFFGRPLDDPGGRNQLHILALSTGQVTRLGPDVPSADVASITYAPAVRSVLVAVREGSLFRVLELPVDGGVARPSMLGFFSEPSGLTAGPDGSVFASLRDRPAEVLRFREGVRATERLATGLTLFRGAVALADGRYLITERLNARTRVLIGAPGQEPTRLVETSEETRDPMTAVGSDHAALLIGSAATPQIAIVAIDSGRIVTRLNVPGTVMSMAASLDGATLYITHEGAVWAVPVDGGPPRVLAEGDSVTVDPDGGDLVVKLDEAAGYRLVRLSPAGGSPRPIAVTGELRLVSRPLMPGAIRNGRLLLAVAAVDSWDWFAGVLDLRTGRLTRLEVDNPTDFHWITWAADGSILASGMGHRSTLWKFTREVAR